MSSVGKDNFCGCLNIYMEWVLMCGSYLCNLVISGELVSSDGFGNVSPSWFANWFKCFFKTKRAAQFVVFFCSDWISFYCLSPRTVALPSSPDYTLFLGEISLCSKLRFRNATWRRCNENNCRWDLPALEIKFLNKHPCVLIFSFHRALLVGQCSLLHCF